MYAAHAAGARSRWNLGRTLRCATLRERLHAHASLADGSGQVSGVSSRDSVSMGNFSLGDHYQFAEVSDPSVRASTRGRGPTRPTPDLQPAAGAVGTHRPLSPTNGNRL